MKFKENHLYTIDTNNANMIAFLLGITKSSLRIGYENNNNKRRLKFTNENDVTFIIYDGDYFMYDISVNPEFTKYTVLILDNKGIEKCKISVICDNTDPFIINDNYNKIGCEDDIIYKLEELIDYETIEVRYSHVGKRTVLHTIVISYMENDKLKNISLCPNSIYEVDTCDNLINFYDHNFIYIKSLPIKIDEEVDEAEYLNELLLASDLFESLRLEAENKAKEITDNHEKNNDSVNNPSHYTSGKIEVIDFIEDQKLGFNLGNAIKYITRAGKKDSDKYVEDLKKAIWYLEREISNNE